MANLPHLGTQISSSTNSICNIGTACVILFGRGWGGGGVNFYHIVFVPEGRKSMEGGGWKIPCDRGALRRESVFSDRTNPLHMHDNVYFVHLSPHTPTRGSRGVGKRYTSAYDHDM